MDTADTKLESPTDHFVGLSYSTSTHPSIQPPIHTQVVDGNASMFEALRYEGT